MWRTITGFEPNSLTLIVQKISWAVFFFTCWYMLWKFDSFFLLNSGRKVQSDHKKQNDEKEIFPNEKEVAYESPEESKDFEDEEDFDTEPLNSGTDEYDEEVLNEIKFSFVDVKYAEILGLSEPFKLEDIKPAYRKLIAQYHPDRVAAMGKEIQEVAEQKAKEINRTYDYFQKKFDIS